MAFELPKLPYKPDALSPFIGAETIEFHYGKHHQAYVWEDAYISITETDVLNILNHSGKLLTGM